jgi:hypothetical protein
MRPMFLRSLAAAAVLWATPAVADDCMLEQARVATAGAQAMVRAAAVGPNAERRQALVNRVDAELAARAAPCGSGAVDLGLRQRLIAEGNRALDAEYAAVRARQDREFRQRQEDFNRLMWPNGSR